MTILQIIKLIYLYLSQANLFNAANTNPIIHNTCQVLKIVPNLLEWDILPTNLNIYNMLLIVYNLLDPLSWKHYLIHEFFFIKI